MAKRQDGGIRLRPVGTRKHRQNAPAYSPAGTGCPAFEQAVENLYKGQNEESFWTLMGALNYALEMETHVLVPLRTALTVHNTPAPWTEHPVPTAKAKDLQLWTLRNEKGRTWLPMFTSAAAACADRSTSARPMADYTLQDAMELALSTEGIDGVVLDPWSHSATLDGALLNGLLHAGHTPEDPGDEKADAGKEAARKGNWAQAVECFEKAAELGSATSAPAVNGYVRMDSSAVYVTAVGSSFRFDKQDIKIKNNLISFDKYNIYASGINPFVVDGTIDIHNLSRMTANLKLTAHDMQLLNVKRNKESMVYGKLLVNLNSTVKGPLDALIMRGDLQLLGGTNVTYVMQESPLTAQDRLADLVTFTDFSDTLLTRRHRPEAPLPIGGLDMLMTIRIDQAVRLNADITPDQSSRVELEGGGDLSFQYTTQGEMILNGRYTLSGGMVKYAMPIIPLKEFTIQDGSYVQWSGNPMDPMLNLTATERMRASVTQDDGSSRLVTFNVGVAIKQTLENLQLQFILSAPEDQSMQQELDKMGEGQRSQIAVTMLVTGMYLNMSDVGGGGKKPSLDMGAALNSFLQSEINNIAGSALKSVDITLGMEQYDQNGTGSGGERTDFSFRFAKRFYNDRISIILGGRVSTGQDVNAGQSQQFIDNVSIEYRLDGSGTRYIKLFHDKNYESLLEGEITETGAGIVLRKKMLNLRELFIFKKNKPKPVTDDKQTEEKK